MKKIIITALFITFFVCLALVLWVLFPLILRLINVGELNNWETKLRGIDGYSDLEYSTRKKGTNYSLEIISPFEIYVVDAVSFMPDSPMTKEEIEKRFSRFAEKANQGNEGFETKMYVGHNAPDISEWYSGKDGSTDDGTQSDKWTVVFCKRFDGLLTV